MTLVDGLPGDHPEWVARLRMARDDVLPWIDEAIGLEGQTVLEYGCGQGAVTCATAPLVAWHIGIDIDEHAIALARAHAADRGLANVELRTSTVGGIIDDLREYPHARAIDIVLLYAVLEHLHLDERTAVLQAAFRIVGPDGHVVICETPNRLTPMDHHTSQMPFLHALPLGLAAATYRTSPRATFVAAIDAASEDGPAARDDALVRWGRGMSFHDVEVVVGDLAERTVASSYDRHLYPSRPVVAEELQLANLMSSWRPDLPPCWSRRWIDTILTGGPSRIVRRFVRPWPMTLDFDVSGARMNADGCVELRPGAWLPVVLPVQAGELHAGFLAADPAAALRVRVDGLELGAAARPDTAGTGRWHVAVALPNPAAKIEIGLRDGGCLTYVGFCEPDTDR